MCVREREREREREARQNDFEKLNYFSSQLPLGHAQIKVIDLTLALKLDQLTMDEKVDKIRKLSVFLKIYFMTNEMI